MSDEGTTDINFILADAVGDNYDNGKAADSSILWHESGMPDAIDWAGVALDLRSAGYAIVKLPESDDDGPDDDGQFWFDQYTFRADATGSLPHRRIFTDFGMGNEFLTDMPPARARTFAAALLAAADAAEGRSVSLEHVVTRINDGWYVCDTCGLTGSERWANLHQFPSRYTPSGLDEFAPDASHNPHHRSTSRGRPSAVPPD